ncbi:hypothetical protein [Embleya sp. AB8]|uniref:hypothetical protein n=1 Tax=Embleya sp. AB8 TaxID=3156304 RepID=UPI003C78C48C
MTTPMTRLRRWYGAGPAHLLALAACFALAWYAGTRLLTYEPARVAVWFAGAAVVHDLALFPLYSTIDRTAQATTHRAVNYLRVPAALSALLFLVWLPEILRVTTTYRATTTLDDTRFLPHWLLLTAALFATSALVFAARTAIRRLGRN